MTLSYVPTILATDPSQVREHAPLPPLPRSPKPRMSADCSGNGPEASVCRPPPDRYLDARPCSPCLCLLCWPNPMRCCVCAVLAFAPNALNLRMHLDLWALRCRCRTRTLSLPLPLVRLAPHSGVFVLRISQTRRGRDAHPYCGSFRKLAAVRSLGPSAGPLRTRRSIGRSQPQALSHGRFSHASASRATPSAGAAGETLIRSRHNVLSCPWMLFGQIHASGSTKQDWSDLLPPTKRERDVDYHMASRLDTQTAF